MSPRIPANCLTWSIFPRAPDSDMIRREFNSPVFFISSSMFFRIRLVMSLVTFSQVSVIWFLLSSWEMIPLLNWSLKPLTFSSAALMIWAFSGGTIMSAVAMEKPALVANSKPRALSSSSMATVFSDPTVW